MRPYREFSGSEGDYSVDDRGPEFIKADLDKLFRMFNPLAIHPNGEQGGVGFVNLNFNFGDNDFLERIGGNLRGIDMDAQEIIDKLSAQIGSNHAPALKADDMKDITKIYVYTGSEPGYTYGDWYYWNGSEWVSGGPYRGPKPFAYFVDEALVFSIDAPVYFVDKALIIEDML